MQINTKKVKGRRAVRYASLDELLADAEKFAGDEVRALGNWSPGQIYTHLAESFDSSIDGFDFSMPAPARWMLTLLFKRKFLKKELPPGFKGPPEQFTLEKIAAEEGLASLRSAIARQKKESPRVPHPGFGNIGREGWNDFHLRHAEMHMSFLVEGENYK